VADLTLVGPSSLTVLESITEADNYDPSDNDAHGVVRTDFDESYVPTPIRPREFRSFMVAPFVSLLVGLAIALGVLLAKSQPHGNYTLAR
jgi:hypothetical protein